MGGIHGLQQIFGQAACFRSEQKRISGLETMLAVRRLAVRRDGQRTRSVERIETVIKAVMYAYFGKFTVIETGPPQFLVVEIRILRHAVRHTNCTAVGLRRVW